MLDQIFAQQFTTAIDITAVIISLLSALAMGGLIALAYHITHRNIFTKNGFAVTLIIFPAVVTLIIMLIGDNVARAFTLAGAFSIIRFRSIAGEPLDMAYTFSALGIGMACGMGYFGYAALFAILLSCVFVIAYCVSRARSNDREMLLKIVVPENMNFTEKFDLILDDYTSHYKLLKVKTAEFGTVFEITYKVILEKDTDPKEFIDKLRCLNGNMNITLNMGETLKVYE